MADPQSLIQILWSTDPATQRAVGTVLGLAVLCALLVFVPLGVRLVRLLLFERRLRHWLEYAAASLPVRSSAGASRTARPTLDLDYEELRAMFVHSPLRAQYDEFERRWRAAQLGETIDRAPIRLIDILDERPLLPFGPRRSLLPILPGLFLGVGVVAALAGLIPSLGGLGADGAPEATRSAWLATQLGLALRASTWGFLCAVGASLTGRLIEGAFEARSHALDELVERAFGSVSPGELAEITRQTQQKSLEILGSELSRFASEMNERLDRGLQRIEQSTARSASLVSQEQRGALHTVVQELSLSVRQGVEHHLSELRAALQRAVEHQSSVTGGLAETFERMVENAQTQDRVARTLIESASSVEAAANAMRGSSTEWRPILEHLSTTSRGLSETAERMGETQKVVARAAEGVRSSLEHAATGVEDQRQFIEQSLGEIRRALVGLNDGIGDGLQRSLREVDDVLESTIGQLRNTLAESNETIARLAGPIRAAEGTTRETHLALDRVRGEVEALGQWMTQAIKPLRSGLGDVEARAEDIARTMLEFTNNTRQIDKTMEALRESIHEESRRLQGTGSDLTRSLKLASDSVHQLEGGAAGAGRVEPGSDAGRSWTPAPPPRDDASTPLAGSPGALEEDADEPTSGVRHEPPAALGSLGRNAAGRDGDPTGTELARGEASSTTFRVGAPRAQGPDPYRRFEGDAEPPSNVRHFPTRDRELGDDLKLSGLLGPSRAEPAGGDAADGASDTTDDSPRDGRRRGRTAKSSDESD